MRIRVGHLYPDELNIYADRGNIAVLAARARARGHELDVCGPLGMGDAIPSEELPSILPSAAARTAIRSASPSTWPPSASALQAPLAADGAVISRRLRWLPAARTVLP